MEIEAGIEMDAQVHSEVMQETWPEDRCRICGWTLAASIEEGCTKDSCSLRPKPSRRADDPPPYSTRLDAAHVMEGKIRERRLIKEYVEALMAQISEPFITFLPRHLFKLANASADERCRAALEAVKRHSSQSVANGALLSKD